MIKAASYGKSFLNRFEMDPEVFTAPNKLLKIRSSLMYECGMAITYAQIIAMGREKLIYLMLHLKAHFLAIESCKLLKMDVELLSLVFTDWAITVMDREKDDRDKQEELANKIYERFNQLQSEIGMRSSTNHRGQNERHHFN